MRAGGRFGSSWSDDYIAEEMADAVGMLQVELRQVGAFFPGVPRSFAGNKGIDVFDVFVILVMRKSLGVELEAVEVKIEFGSASRGQAPVVIVRVIDRIPPDVVFVRPGAAEGTVVADC